MTKIRNHRSPIWKVSLEKFKEVIETSKSVSEAMNRFGLSNKGGNSLTLKKRAQQEGIDIKLLIERGKVLNKAIPKTKISTNEILSVNSTYNRSQLKLRLVKEKLIMYLCSICGIDSWQNKKLSLQIDHINGVSNDNRLENLRFLCPNCHSQTSTFSGKNIKPRETVNKYCLDCGTKISKDSLRCRNCVGKSKIKINWPSIEDLRKMVAELGYKETGRQLGVSDNAIRHKIFPRKPNTKVFGTALNSTVV